MRVQQVPNSPYFIHYDDEGFGCADQCCRLFMASGTSACRISTIRILSQYL